ncbi:DUF4395 domain-containing protein [Ammoniphilus sp. CFH 90114]|uniref:DUF4395 domain-containing protein n=1 Tax=Ammoniphilus sp. CFH 90114 TaxID=2493665 RepID=UPI00196A84BD|nr:DUF4395 domain-containing protein [Ammoniphilus sp. CFH 90114]
MEKPLSIPRPLVRTNQWVIVLCVVMTWLTNQSWFLLIPLAAGISGLIFGFNPIMRVAKLFLKKHPSEYIPEEWEQQQFNQKIAVLCLLLGWLGYLADWTLLAYGFTIMVALAAFIAILGFCIGCYVRFQWLMYRNRKRQA